MCSNCLPTTIREIKVICYSGDRGIYDRVKIQHIGCNKQQLISISSPYNFINRKQDNLFVKNTNEHN